MGAWNRSYQIKGTCFLKIAFWRSISWRFIVNWKPTIEVKMVEWKLIKNENSVIKQVIRLQNQRTWGPIGNEVKSHQTEIWISQLLENSIRYNETGPSWTEVEFLEKKRRIQLALWWLSNR